MADGEKSLHNKYLKAVLSQIKTKEKQKSADISSNDNEVAKNPPEIDSPGLLSTKSLDKLDNNWERVKDTPYFGQKRTLTTTKSSHHHFGKTNGNNVIENYELAKKAKPLKLKLSKAMFKVLKSTSD